MDDLAALARLVDVLRPWSGHLVIAGGWAHRLFRFHRLAYPPAHMPVRTRDADVVLSPRAPLIGHLAQALETADFHEEFSGDETPPITRYRLGTEDDGFYVEFLVPLHGSGLKKNGAPDVTVATAGITAQKLRHLDLLLVSPWVVRLGIEVGVPLDTPADVMIANAVSFIAQKLLIQKHRAPRKQAQDTLYIHDTLELFGRELGALRKLWIEEVRPTLPPRTAKNVGHLCHERFGAVTDVIREGARIPQDRTLTPTGLQAACAYGLEQVFSV